MKGLEIQVNGGAGEIGGNKVFIKASDKQFLFDFGLSFKDNEIYFDTFLQPRRFNGMIDYLRLGFIPAINNLYRNDMILTYSNVLQNQFKIDAGNQNCVDAFFLSHPHMDHYKFSSFLKKKTPFFMNWVCKVMMEYISDVSMDPLISDVLEYYELFKKVPKKRQKAGSNAIEYKRATKNDYDPSEKTRNIRIIEDNSPIIFESTEGNIEIKSCRVDHSIPGSSAFIISQAEKSIIYTGDFRLHGFHKDWMEKFIEEAKNSNPTAILCDGALVPNTRTFNSDKFSRIEESEEGVEKRSEEIIKAAPGLVLVNFPVRNLDRFLIYHRLAKKLDRVFVVMPKMFKMIEYFWKSLENQSEPVKQDFLKAYPLPNINDPDSNDGLAIYLERKGWGKFEGEDYRTLDREIFDSKKFITYKEIHDDPSKFLMYLDFFMLTELIDINLPPNQVIYLKSETDAFNEEMEMQEEKLNAWLKHFGITKTQTIHSSGHSSVNDLIDTLQKINADNVIPIHTENPKTFERFGLSGKIIVPKRGKTYKF